MVNLGDKLSTINELGNYHPKLSRYPILDQLQGKNKELKKSEVLLHEMTEDIITSAGPLTMENLEDLIKGVTEETTAEKIIARIAEIEGQRYLGNKTMDTGGILLIGPRWANEFKKDDVASETILNISFELAGLQM